MGKQTELMGQLREIFYPPTTSPLADDLDTKLRMLEKFINNRFVPKATHDKRINGYKHRALQPNDPVGNLEGKHGDSK